MRVKLNVIELLKNSEKELSVKKLSISLLAAWLFAQTAAYAADMTVSAAASLTNAFNELSRMYSKSHPGVKIFTNYAASNPLLKQMVEGAPVDVFASADEATMDDAQKAGVVNGDTRRTFAINDLVVIVPKGNARPGKLADLEKLEKIAIGDPAAVPAGRYTKGALENAGLWNSLEKKFIPGTNVRQVLEYVGSGEVDAGFVYATDAKQLGDKVDVAFVAPVTTPVRYSIAVATTGQNPREGAAFVDFILSGPAGEVLKKYGFSLPEKPWRQARGEFTRGWGALAFRKWAGGKQNGVFGKRTFKIGGKAVPGAVSGCPVFRQDFAAWITG